MQEQLLQAEKKRIEEMERLRLEKEQLLEDEMRMRENLEERHKEQEKLLEEVSMNMCKQLKARYFCQ